MTNEELKAAIEYHENMEEYSPEIIQAARELLQLKDGTHPDMVMVPRKRAGEFDTWFVFDGDISGLCEFCDALDWNNFRKGGRDKAGYFITFLCDGDKSIGAIRSRSNKLHIMALDYLRGDDAQKGNAK